MSRRQFKLNVLRQIEVRQRTVKPSFCHRLRHDFVHVVPAPVPRRHERLPQTRLVQYGPFACPCSEHHRQPGQLFPLRPQIQPVPAQPLRLQPQRRIANHQGGIAIGQHRVQVRGMRAQLGRYSIAFPQEDPRQRHGGSGTGIHRKCTDLAKRLLREQQDASYCTFTSDPHVGQKFQTHPFDLGARHQTNLRFIAGQSFRTSCRKVKSEVETTALRAVQKTPNEGPCIQVTDGGNAQFSSLANRLSREAAKIDRCSPAANCFNPRWLSLLLFMLLTRPASWGSR